MLWQDLSSSSLAEPGSLLSNEPHSKPLLDTVCFAHKVLSRSIGDIAGSSRALEDAAMQISRSWCAKEVLVSLPALIPIREPKHDWYKGQTLR